MNRTQRSKGSTGKEQTKAKMENSYATEGDEVKATRTKGQGTATAKRKRSPLQNRVKG